MKTRKEVADAIIRLFGNNGITLRYESVDSNRYMSIWNYNNNRGVLIATIDNILNPTDKIQFSIIF
jgi:hypothetical protein